MATRTTRTAAAAASAAADSDSSAPAPLTGLAASAYVTIWVFRRNVGAVNGKTRFVRVLRGDAANLVDAEQAQYTKGSGRLRYIEGCEPRGYPPGPAPFYPATVSITAFTAASATVASVSAVDAHKLRLFDTLRLQALSGEPDAIAAIDGVLTTVVGTNSFNNTYTLQIDLSGVDVTGLTAGGTKVAA